MQYETFVNDPKIPFPVAILVPKLDRNTMLQEYVEPGNLNPDDVIAYTVPQEGKKTKAARCKEYLDELLPHLVDIGVEYLLVGEGEYFKALTGVAKTDAYIGYVLPNAYPENAKNAFKVLYIPNYRQVFYNQAPTRAKIKQSLDALWNHRHGTYREPGCSIISYSDYPTTTTAIAAWLEKLMKMPALAADIEAFSLKHYSSGIGTIAFAWSKHEGIAFPVDLGNNPPAVRKLLARFFSEYKGNLKWHNISYDVYALIFQLFMDHLIDTEGLLNGLRIFLDRSWDDTKLISYLATNSTAGNKLGLKDQSQEFAGNYAQEDIKNITLIPLPQLLEYNLVDAMATWFVYEKNHPIMVADQQEQLYEELFKPAIWDIIQMQLTGLPLDMNKVRVAKAQLEADRSDALRRIQGTTLIKAFTHILDQRHVEKRNSELKTKRIQLGDEPQEFNPNSGPQLQELLYEYLELPIIERTKSKQPSTGAEVLEKLKAFTTNQQIRDLLDAFLDYKAVDKIYTAFIPAMEAAVQGPDGWYYLFGNFNLGGTVSGRLSSSDPNLQTIPANSKYAKLIKDCFRAPPGWLFVGLDFFSLEDRISALTTKDPNKMAVYIDGFDGHCLRAQSYFSEKMPDIERAPEGELCFKAIVDGKEVFFHAKEQITYLGTSMTGLELWNRLSNVQVLAE